MTKTKALNSLLVTLEPGEDGEVISEELEERDDVVRVSVLEVEAEIYAKEESQ